MDISYRIKNFIESEGKISLNRFMEEVISHPSYSYYNDSVIGSNGDFITSPEISQLFGEMIGIWCVTIWQKLNFPDKIAIVELGAGNGTLMNDLLRATKHVKNFHSSIKLYFIEISDFLKSEQYEKLKEYDIEKKWYKSIKYFSENIPTIFIANEFFDALPISQYTKYGKYWFEKYVQLNENYELIFTDIKLNAKEEENFNLDYQNIENGGIVEVSPQSIDYIKYIIQIIKKNSGAALVIDYGYLVEDCDKVKTNSTLQAVRNHKYSSILSDVGQSDITAHVDFCKLIEIISLYGLEYNISSQKDFLVNLGINIRAQNLARNLNVEMQNDLYVALDRLISVDKMGELFKALTIY